MKKKFEATHVKTVVLDTPLGAVLLAVTEKGLHFTSFVGEKGFPLALMDSLAETPRVALVENNAGGYSVQFTSRLLQQKGMPQGPAALLWQTIQDLADYFSGKRVLFVSKFDYLGTPFQREVWRFLLTIPYGETVSYSDVALGINRPRAVRAVGNAIGSNPIGIIIPCHRVIGKNGALGGYAGGIERKKALLRLEKNGSLA